MKNKSGYVWYRDKKMIGTILLIFIVSMQLFAWLKVPFLTSIHGYTVGMVMGVYNPIFYIFVGYKALVLIFGEKVKLPKWFKLNEVTYWLVALAVIFIGVSFTFYQKESGYTAIGLTPWKSFNSWFDSFTANDDAWIPVNTNGGVVGVFMYSFTSMISSGIGALIISIVLIVVVISYIITGSSIGFYKQLKTKRKLFVKDETKKIDKDLSVDNLIKKDTPNEETKPEPKNDLPFDDPFS